MLLKPPAPPKKMKFPSFAGDLHEKNISKLHFYGYHSEAEWTPVPTFPPQPWPRIDRPLKMWKFLGFRRWMMNGWFSGIEDHSKIPQASSESEFP